jgi:Brp/Blh family beta-carotene 15,15'-monooxygenase
LKFSDISIIATFFGLWISKFFEAPSQQIFALLLIFSVGILHGSNDLNLIVALRPNLKSNKKYLFYIFYILIVIIACILFYFAPIFALITFIFFSAYHFGEQHLQNILIQFKFLQNFGYFIYGVWILSVLFYLNESETREIIQTITKVKISLMFLKSLFFVNTLLVLLFFVRLLYKKLISVRRFIFELFLMLIFSIVFGVATLLWAFALYFIFWHSIPSIIEQINFIYGEFNNMTLLKYIKSSLIVWSISIIGLIGLYFVVIGNEKLFIALVFSFLGAITFAHTFIMAVMLKKKQVK